MRRDFAPGCSLHFYERLFFKFEKWIAGKFTHAAGVAPGGFTCMCLLFYIPVFQISAVQAFFAANTPAFTGPAGPSKSIFPFGGLGVFSHILSLNNLLLWHTM